jgi:hypothetical protein
MQNIGSTRRILHLGNSQARGLGAKGTLRHELERRYHDDTARWEEFTESLDAADPNMEHSIGPAVPATPTITALQSAHQLAGVDQTITPHRKRHEDGVQRNSPA